MKATLKQSLAILGLLLLFVSSSRADGSQPPIPSPDHSLTLHTSVEHSRKDPTAYGCVIVEMRDKTGKVLHRENSHASAFQRWTISWATNNEFQLTSSDIGTSVWKRQPDGVWKRQRHNKATDTATK